MEEPKYAEFNHAEIREIEAELGHPVTRELAQWFIRNRMNREAVERMFKTEDASRFDVGPNVRNVHSIKKVKNRKPVSDLKKIKKKCA